MAQDPYKYFRVEARELVEQLGRGVLELEKGARSADVVPRLLRLAHTLKGAARVVKQREIADAAHTIEDTLAALRDAGSAAPQDRVDAVLKLIDDISKRVTTLIPVAEPEVSSPARSVPEEPFRTVRADVAEMDALLDGVAEASVQLAGVRETARSLVRARQVANLLAEQLAVPRSRAMPTGNSLASTKAGALAEELRNLVVKFERNLTIGVEQIDRELRQVRDATERLRLLPASAVFGSLERTARDVAQATGKRVVFEGKGGDIRLDAHVLGSLQGALVQIVRNAVAHGIEPESERQAAGKALEGHCEIEVVRRSERVAFICRDDGRGVDVDAIRRAAQRKGLLSPDTQKLGPDELLRLLLKGGLSTSGVVTEVSGRGIGLDVVREAAEHLGGDVRVETVGGKGTIVEVIVPVSLSSLDALIVEAGGTSASIPLDAVRGTLRLGPNDVTHTPEGDTILYEGQVIPFIPLEQPFTRNRRVARAARPWTTVVVQGGDGLAAVGVDRLLGTANVVLRPLPEFTPADPIVFGASLDSEGNPQVVLDADGLVVRARRGQDRATVEHPSCSPILVIDDSPTTRMLEQSILEAAGYEVEVAASGEEAMAKTRQRAYALFLVDVEMPGMDGFTFVERTRTDPALRDIPAILVTSRNSPEDRQRGEDVGARAYIVKSEFDQTDLLERIHRLVA